MSQEKAKNIYETLKAGLLAVPKYPMAGRAYGYTLRSWNRRDCGDLEIWKKYIALHRDLGYNNVNLDLAWGDIEAKRGVFDFSGYDDYLQVLVDAGLTLQLKLNSRKIPDWAKANRDALLCGPGGKVIDEARIVTDEGIPTAPYHSLADPAMNEALQAFYNKVAGHCRGLPNLFYCSAFACAFESEYHGGTWTDYSPAAQRQFRDYLRTAYGSLKDLNAAWKTSYGTWDAAGIAWQPPETMQEGLPDVRYIDFMKYREWSALRFFSPLHDAIKAADPKAEYGPQVGRIVCQIGMLRGAIGVFHWAGNCEWIFVDPAPVDDYAWEMAVARAGGKKVAVELDGPYMYRAQRLDSDLPALYADQTLACYEHGADYVCHANWGEMKDYERGIREGMYERIAQGKQAAFKVPPATDAIYVGKWDSYLRRYAADHAWDDQPGQVREDSIARFQELRKQGKTVDVVMDDTILQNPARLKQYARIHVPVARFVARPAWEALQKSGVPLVFGPEVREVRDETGIPL